MDQPLAWLKSFLSDRLSCVVLGQSRSPWVPAPFGVPQDSVLGPLLYLLYTVYYACTVGVGPSFICWWPSVHIHADPQDAKTVLTQMSQSIDALTSWMATNHCLHLNPSKTQAIWLSGRLLGSGLIKPLPQKYFFHAFRSGIFCRPNTTDWWNLISSWWINCACGFNWIPWEWL